MLKAEYVLIVITKSGFSIEELTRSFNEARSAFLRTEQTLMDFYRKIEST